MNIQVGAGIIGMLFDNKVQFGYGWNLNADRKRRYFGIGFNFVNVATEVSDIIKQE